MADFWNNQSPRTKVTIFASAILAAIVFVFVLGLGGGSGSYTLLSTNLDAQTSAKITAALKGQNIPYQLTNAGQTVEVASAKIDDARALLATNNLVAGGHVGWELCNKTKLGTTDFQQKLLYQQCLQDAVALSLQQVQGVQTASVTLAMPEQTVFSSEQQPTTASVLLNLGGNVLTGSQIKGVAQLVASSVPKLDISKVTITDESGNLLWGGGTTNGVSASGSDSKLALENSYDQQTAASLNSMLTQVLGPGKVVVQVKADLNMDAKHIQSEIWGNTVRPLTRQATNETFKGNGAPPSGAAGTAANTATGYAVGAAGSVANNYRNRTSNQTNAIDKTITTTDVAPGTVQRQTVSVLVDSSIPPTSLPGIQQSVQSAIGYNRARGDVVTVQAVKFATPAVVATPSAGPLSPSLISMLKVAGTILLGLIALFWLYRRATRSTQQVLTIAAGDMPRAPAGALAEGGYTEADLDQLTSGTAELTREAITREAIKRQASEAAAKHPTESGMILQKWLGDN
jgi:flagellar M-ring protein FliF